MGLTPVQGQPSACPETVWSGQLCIHFVCVLLGGFGFSPHCFCSHVEVFK